MKQIHWGILGYARIAKNEVIPALLEAPTARLYGIASRDTEKREEARSLFPFERVYETYEELLEDEHIQAVYIPLPNALHKEWAVKAMEKGKHVLCEKPLALSEKEVKDMTETSEKYGVLLMEAFMYRYTHRIRKVLELVQSGVLGEIRHIDSSFRFYLNRPNTIKMKKELGGGALYDVGCYPVNFANLLLKEEPQEIAVSSVMTDGVDIETSVLLTYKNGVTASLHCGFNAYGVNSSEILGTEGRLVIPDTFLEEAGDLTLYHKNQVENISVPGCHRYTLEVEDFSKAVLEGKKPLISLSESLLQARVMDRILWNIYK